MKVLKLKFCVTAILGEGGSDEDGEEGSGESSEDSEGIYESHICK